MLPFEYVPVAVSCTVAPTATLVGFGVTAMEDRVGAVTVKVSPGETTEPEVAVMLVVPAATPVAKPLELTVATEVAEDAHVTLDVRF